MELPILLQRVIKEQGKEIRSIHAAIKTDNRTDKPRPCQLHSFLLPGQQHPDREQPQSLRTEWGRGRGRGDEEKRQ